MLLLSGHLESEPWVDRQLSPQGPPASGSRAQPHPQPVEFSGITENIQSSLPLKVRKSRPRKESRVTERVGANS